MIYLQITTAKIHTSYDKLKMFIICIIIVFVNKIIYNSFLIYSNEIGTIPNFLEGINLIASIFHVSFLFIYKSWERNRFQLISYEDLIVRLPFNAGRNCTLYVIKISPMLAKLEFSEDDSASLKSIRDSDISTCL